MEITEKSGIVEAWKGFERRVICDLLKRNKSFI